MSGFQIGSVKFPESENELFSEGNFEKLDELQLKILQALKSDHYDKDGTVKVLEATLECLPGHVMSIVVEYPMREIYVRADRKGNFKLDVYPEPLTLTYIIDDRSKSDLADYIFDMQDAQTV